MPTPIPPDRLPRLKKALDAYGIDDMESQQQLAAIYGVALSRMVTLIHNRFKDFPQPERRGDKTHWYKARAAIQCMIDYTEGRGALKRASASRAAAVLAGKDVPAGDADSGNGKGGWPEGLLTPTELDRLASAQTRIWRLRREQGLYLVAAEVEDMVRRVYSVVTSRIMNIPSVIDANGRLPPQERQALQRECREINLALYGEIEGLIGDVERGTAGSEGSPDGARHHSARRRPGKHAGAVPAPA